MEQMSLMALADTIATTSTDLKDNQSKNQGSFLQKTTIYMDSLIN